MNFLFWLLSRPIFVRRIVLSYFVAMCCFDFNATVATTTRPVQSETPNTNSNMTNLLSPEVSVILYTSIESIFLQLVYSQYVSYVVHYQGATV
jgi:hypothetical protein